ncbi:hypothetical protein JMM61_20520 [Rhodovulum sulfidophilum]|uniref:hypothetical protein n=1 Tax=Rhodovulum sulfidophilum TaxID=35806 RepID=UPI0019273DE4|nr:hypothetical protein [Rhodovulum sulfidophilum]MBL3587699.1 hypothetical protein [Rhodovulum sulfidophilum]
MRESSKFVYSLAALWFAFIPPGIARLLVIAAAGLALFLAWWLTQSADLVVGVVTDLRPGGPRGKGERGLPRRRAAEGTKSPRINAT